MGWWVADLMKADPARLVAHVVWVIVAICLHELAHGWAAIKFGDRTPIETGHMTWNPLVHMGPMSLLMFALVGIAWGMMPVSPHRLRGRHAEAIVAAAGPAMNFLLAALSLVAGALWLQYGTGTGDNLYRNLGTFFILGVVLNIGLAIFNLLPVPPLDGSRILAHYSRGYAELLRHPRADGFALIGLIVLFLWAGPLIWTPGLAVVDYGLSGLQSILP